MAFRRGTNNFTELSATYHIIRFALEKGCIALQLFGDSKIVCDWLNRVCCRTFTLRHILDEALRLTSLFDHFSCNHIYREQNTEADRLSKEGAIREQDNWLIIEYIDGEHHQFYHRPFMEILI